MKNKIHQRVRFLEVYAIISTLVFGLLLFTSFTEHVSKRRFTEIDVERLNIIEKDGKLRLVIANNERSPAMVLDGKTFGPSGGRPGLTFYNEEGDESGGMGVGGGQDKGNAFGILAFDQQDQDQVLALEYSDQEGQRQVGLTVLDRPEVALSEVIQRQQAIDALPNGPAKDSALKHLSNYQGGVPYGARRLFVGRDPSKTALIKLADKLGRTRLQLAVDSLGAAHVDFLDENGQLTYRLPNSGKASQH